MGPVGDEHNTPVDREQLAGLRPSWIATQADLNMAEAENILKAQTWLRRQSTDLEAVLSPDWQALLHRKMFGDVWKWAGKWRKTETNIGVDYWLIPVQLKELNENFTLRFAVMPPAIDELVIDFHHQLVSVHPFPNGNGRHARAMANVLADLLGCKPFTWGGGSISNMGDTRARYVAALQMADQGNLAPLIDFARAE